MSRYRFALKPKWVLSHLFVLALIVAMINAGFWQLRRLHEKQDRNAKVEQRFEEKQAPVETLAKPGEYSAADDLEFRPVTATGSYLKDAEVLVRSRSLEGSPGSWVISPLRLEKGEIVAINRGFIYNSGQLESVPKKFQAPTGEVTVEGIVRKTETKGSFGATDPASGELTNLARVDVARLDKQTNGDFLPFYVQLTNQDPQDSGERPEPVPLPEQDEGNHFSYAVQWFIFTTIAFIGYPLILQRRARELEKESDFE